MKEAQQEGEFLLRKGKIVVGKDLALRKDLLLHFDDSALGGHSGTPATMKRIAQTFYWKGTKKDIYNNIQECSVCQRNKSETVASPGLLIESGVIYPWISSLGFQTLMERQPSWL